MGSIKKLYLDTRFRNSGEHYNAEFVLPLDVETQNVQSVVLAGCTFTNTLDTVLGDVNEHLYFLAQYNRTIQTGINNVVTLAYTTGATQKIDDTCNRFYIRAQLPARRDFIVTLINGIYSPSGLADELMRALRTVPELSNVVVSWMTPVPPTPNALVFATTDARQLLIPTAQNLLTMIDWIGPQYDPTNPRSLNAFLLPPTTYSNLVTSPVDLQSAETVVAGTIPQGVYTGAQLTAALQTIVRVSVPSATLTWSEGSRWFYLQSGAGFRMRFVGRQSFNKYLGTSSIQRDQYHDGADHSAPGLPRRPHPRLLHGASIRDKAPGRHQSLSPRSYSVLLRRAPRYRLR